MMLLHRTKLAGKSNAGTTCHFTDLTLNSVYVLVSFALVSCILFDPLVCLYVPFVSRLFVSSFLRYGSDSFVRMPVCLLAHSLVRSPLVCSLSDSHTSRLLIRWLAFCSLFRSFARSFSRYEGYSVASVGKFRSITLAFIKHDTALHKRKKRGKLK